MSEVTKILDSIRSGNADAVDQLLPHVYRELRAMATQQMALQPAGHTLQATCLVHDAWLKLVGTANYSWEGRRHFLNTAAKAMRQILIDAARRKRAVRHGGGCERTELDIIELPQEFHNDRFLAVEDAMDRLALEHPGKAELVRLKYYVGLTNNEAASLLGMQLRTVERHWAFARAWLKVDIEGGQVE